MQGARLLLIGLSLSSVPHLRPYSRWKDRPRPDRSGGTTFDRLYCPRPDFMAVIILAGADRLRFRGRKGRDHPGPAGTLILLSILAGPFLYAVPDARVLGGSIGLGFIVPIGNQCGTHLFIGEPRNCTSGVGDPYAEIDWSHSFGKLRPSKFPGAYPILQGLTILVGFGIVFPGVTYDASDPLQQALSISHNIWDFAPTAGFTYTTPPILADGTEISVRFFWNNYIENRDTHYWTGDLLDLEFAVSERIGRFQVGVTGFYAFQVEDDELFGLPVPPDGRRTKALALGPILNFDMPEYSSS